MPARVDSQIAFKDVLTLGNAASGVLAIAYAFFPLSYYPLVFLLLAMAFDHLDGLVARRTKKANAFGKELDSLTDVVSFAAAPVVLMMANYPHDVLLLLSAVVFVCAGVLRLALYNTQKERGVYFGLPIPFAALFVVLSFYGSYYHVIPRYADFAMLWLAAFLMLSRYRIRKPGYSK